MLGKKTLALAVLLLACLPTVNAYDESQEYCINSTHRYWERNIYLNNTLYSFNDTEYCWGGCLAGRCKPDTDTSSPIALAILFSICSFTLIYAGLKMSGPMAVLGYFFIPLGLIVMAVGFVIIINTGAYATNIALPLSLVAYGACISFVLFMLLFYIKIIRRLKDVKKGKSKYK